MEELIPVKLIPENQLLLEQPLLRLPFEQARKNFKIAQGLSESVQNDVLKSITSTAQAASKEQDPATTMASLDSMLGRLHGLKRRLENLHEEETIIHKQSKKRVEHLKDLYGIPSLADVKYDEWSKIRLNRLLVDYLLRNGYDESARALAEEEKIQDLVDCNVFGQCRQIASSLQRRSVAEALRWCHDHKPLMKKANSSLEFELRLQQFIELRRTGKVAEARQHAQRFLTPQLNTYPELVRKAAGLLAFRPETGTQPFRELYSPERWNHLSGLFVRTHHDLFALPPRPLLHTSLSAGLSALKTPSCHSAYASSSANTSSSSTSVCPICSTELNDLARNVPYAHHSKSAVEPDPVVLPNGRVYGRKRLMRVSAKAGVAEGIVRDPTTGELFEEERVRKVFIM